MRIDETERLDRGNELQSVRCSFCRKGSNEVGALVESLTCYGSISYICKSCCKLCIDLLSDYEKELNSNKDLIISYMMAYFLYSDAIDLESEKLKPIIYKWLSSLPRIESEIVKLRHGLTDGYVYSCEEIGKRFGITPEQVAEIDTAALAKLQSQNKADRISL
jgi:hypothetical protein